MSRVLILTGTTGSGKTEVSIPLAQQLNGEIINADSRQVYRELNIGTAKPDPEQLAAVPHHLVGHVSIHDRWTAGDFSRVARRLIDEILARNKLPIVVGGSMLYVRALLHGFFDEPDLEPASYEALREEMQDRGIEALYHELETADPELAARTDPHDHHRILRGISIWRMTGRPLSELQKQTETPLPYGYKLYFLYGNREETYARVNYRARQMIEEGLIDEVRKLLDAGLIESNCNALRTHGYQEVIPFLRGEISREEMLENIQKAVRHYVKRQLTWYRAVPETIWIERSFNEPPDFIAKRITENFENEKAR